MKKVSYALAMALLALSANAQSKLDAGSRMALDYFKQVQVGENMLAAPVNMPFNLNTMSRAESTTSVLVSLNPGADLSKIEALGFEVIMSADNIALINGSIEAVEQLAALDEVKAISFGNQVQPKLDKARVAIGADIVQAGGDDLPQAYNGAGVITGIYDMGVDVNHPNFFDEGGNTRIKALWTYSGSDGKGTSRDPLEYTTDNRSENHGTHTMGCMAGSFNKKGGKVAMASSNAGTATVRSTVQNPYYGIATGSDIAATCGQFYGTNVVAAVAQIMDYAQEQGKPVVVNLSLGTSYGPHDGTDVSSQTLAALAKKGIICVAAGNEGADAISIVKNFTESDNSVKTFLYNVSSSGEGVVDIWANNNEDFTVTAVIYNMSTGKTEYSYDISTAKEQTVYLTTSNYTNSSYIHDTAIDNAFSKSALIFTSSKNESTNNRNEIMLSYSLTLNSSNSSKNLVLGLIVTGKAGQRVDIVNYSYDDGITFSSVTQTGWTNGGAELSCTNESAIPGIISVGSFNSRSSWPALNKYIYGYYSSDGQIPDGSKENQISSFSSYGTLVDGTTRPTLLAPGQAIISSNSSYYTANQSSDVLNTNTALYTKNNRDYYWVVDQGTSMATPIVAGTIALWLQADPTLTAEDVINVINETSVKDEYTAANTVQSGAGKLNALAGIKYVLGHSSVKNIAVDSAEKMLVTSAGQNAWQVYVPGASVVNASLYTTSGQLAAKVSTKSETAVISGDNLTKGIYILNANGKSQRVIVK